MTSKVNTSYTLTVLTNFLKIEYASTYRNEYFFVSAVHMEIRDDNTYTIGDNLHDVVTLDFNNCTNVSGTDIEDFIENITEVLIFATIGGTPTADVNLVTIKGVSVATNKGSLTAGTQRFTLATDDCLNIAISGIGTTTSSNNTLLGSIDSGISGLGVTVSANNILLGTIDTSLNNIETDTGNIDLELGNIGITTSANNVLLDTISTGVSIAPTNLRLIKPMGVGLEYRTKLGDHPEIIRQGSIYMESKTIDTTLRTIGMPISSSQAFITYLTAGENLFVTSTSVSDVGVTGDGARTLYISGLDGNWEDLTETVTLNGQDGVTTSGTFLRVNKMLITTSGVTGHNVGDIYLGRTTDTFTSGIPDTDIVYATLSEFNNSTMASFSTGATQGFQYIKGNQYTDATQVKPILFQEIAFFDFGDGQRLQYQVGNLWTSANNSYDFEGAAPYGEKTDIQLRCKTASGTGVGVIYYEYALTDLAQTS